MAIRVLIHGLMILAVLVLTGPGQWLHHQVDHAHVGQAHWAAERQALHASADTPCQDHGLSWSPEDDAQPSRPTPLYPHDCAQCFMLLHSQAVLPVDLAGACLNQDQVCHRLTMASLHRPGQAYLSDLGGRDPPRLSKVIG